jgi:putative oxidoreductase
VLFFSLGLAEDRRLCGRGRLHGQPGLPLANILLVGVIALEVGGGLLLITGWQARWAALALALFLVLTTVIFHAFWSADAAHYQDQLTNFLKTCPSSAACSCWWNGASARPAACKSLIRPH